MSNYSNYLSTFDLQPFQLVWYMKNINNSDNYATKWDVLCTFNGFKQSVGCFVRGGRNGMGCFVRGGKSGMGCFVRGDKNCMGCFVRGGKLMRDVLSGVLKNGMGCYVPGCFVLHSLSKRQRTTQKDRQHFNESIIINVLVSVYPDSSYKYF